jgi:hypothetical protein
VTVARECGGERDAQKSGAAGDDDSTST